MSNLLQTVLYGTFMPPDVPGRFIDFDKTHSDRMAKDARSAKQRAGGVITRISNLLSSKPSDWLDIPTVSTACACHSDTATKALNKLANQHVISKRYKTTGHIGGRVAIFKWIKSHAEEQKAA